LAALAALAAAFAAAPLPLPFLAAFPAAPVEAAASVTVTVTVTVLAPVRSVAVAEVSVELSAVSETVELSTDDAVELSTVAVEPPRDAVELSTEAELTAVPGTSRAPLALESATEAALDCLRAINDASIRWGAAMAEPARAMRGRTARLNNIVKERVVD